MFVFPQTYFEIQKKIRDVFWRFANPGINIGQEFFNKCRLP